LADELVALVLLVVLVVSGVQHVDCVTFSTLGFFLMNHEMRERERERERETQVAFVEGFSFFSWLRGQLWKNFAAIVNPENKPTKVNWTLSWPSPLEICGKTVL